MDFLYCCAGQCGSGASKALSFRGHELRALAASLALRKGASFQEILDAVGWRSSSTFLRHYWRSVEDPTIVVALPTA